MFSLKPSAQTYRLISLILLGILIALPGFAQDNVGFDLNAPEATLTLEIRDADGNPINDFELFARHSETATVVARYQGAAYGTLRLHYMYLPDFVFANDTSVISGPDVELIHEFQIMPGYADAGDHFFHIHAEVDFSEHGPWPNLKAPVEVITVNVLLPDEEDCAELAPLPVPLPEFSGGPELGNAVNVEYTPSCGASYHSGEFIDLTGGNKGTPDADQKNNDSEFHSIRFSDLSDGHKYGFTIVANYDDASALVSEMVITTIDISPPGTVAAPEVLALPGGHIQVTWDLVEDSISGIDHYALKRKMVNAGGYDEPVTVEIYGDFSNAEFSHTYVDEGSDLIDGAQYNYWVETVDNVANVSYGQLSRTVIPDGVLPLVPEVQILNDILVGTVPFIAGPELVLKANSDGTGLEATDFVFFEVVRNSTDGFGDDHFIGTTNFVSGWVDYQAGGTEYTSSVIPEDGNLLNVNNKSFFVRARAMDNTGNLSRWSYINVDDVLVYARADLYAPSAITNLDGTPRFTEDQYVMDLVWNVPSDNGGSGLQSYRIYDRAIALPRDEANVPEWSPVSDILDAGSLDIVDGYVSYTVPVRSDDSMPTEVDYIVLATDFMGHETEPTDEVRIFTFVDRNSLVLSLVCDDGCGEDCENELPVLTGQVHVSWDGYFAQGIENMKFVLTPAGGTPMESIVNVYGLSDFTIALDSDGDYSLTAQPQFTDQLWARQASLPLLFTNDETAPDPVTTLASTGTGTAFQLAWDAVNDANSISGYVASYKPVDAADFTDFPGVIDSLSVEIPFADEFVTYSSYDLGVRPSDCVGNEQLAGNDIVTDMCLRAPVITGHDVINNNETVEIHWDRPMPNASSDWRTIITIQASGDYPPLVKTVHHTTSYHFSPIDESLPISGYYTVTVREQAADDHLRDSDGALYETEESLVEDILLAGNAPGRISNLELFFLPPALVHDNEDYTITMRWDFTAKAEDVLVRITHGGGNGHDPLVEDVALIEGLNTYILDLENLKYSDGSSVYSSSVDGSYPVMFVVHDLLDNVGPALAESIDISASHGITPRVGGYDDGYYSDNTLEMIMEHVGYTLPEASDYIQYQVEAARTADFDASLYAVKDWFTPATGKKFTPCLDECPEIFLRARARFSWDVNDFSNASVTPWSDEYADLGHKWLRLDVTSPYAVTTLRVSGSSAPEGPEAGVVDVHFSWEAVEDRFNSDGEGIGIGEYRIYRRAVNDTFNFDEPLAIVPHSAAIRDTLYFTDINRPMEGPEGSSYVNVRTDSYVVHPVDLLGNVRTRDNGIISATAIPSAPDQLQAQDGDNFGWCWEPQATGPQVVNYVVERTIIYENLGTDYIFEDVAGEDEDFRLVVTGDGAGCPTVAFNHNSAFNNPDFPVYFHVKAMSADGSWESAWSDTLIYLPPATDGFKADTLNQGNIGNLVKFVLDQNFPNPFNPQTTVRYHVPRSSYVNLRIYDVRGQLVKTLVDGTVATGSHSVQWYGDDQAGRAVSTGIYFYKLETPDETLLKRMVLMR